jgi:hypothetical protein
MTKNQVKANTHKTALPVRAGLRAGSTDPQGTPGAPPPAAGHPLTADP